MVRVWDVRRGLQFPVREQASGEVTPPVCDSSLIAAHFIPSKIFTKDYLILS
jgi:hypothetical protein